MSEMGREATACTHNFLRWDEGKAFCVECDEPDAGRETTSDQSYCEVGRHQACGGYTEDESDPESCMCDCHDEVNQ